MGTSPANAEGQIMDKKAKVPKKPKQPKIKGSRKEA
jgi:hypothetical protein